MMLLLLLLHGRLHRQQGPKTAEFCGGGCCCCCLCCCTKAVEGSVSSSVSTPNSSSLRLFLARGGWIGRVGRRSGVSVAGGGLYSALLFFCWFVAATVAVLLLLLWLLCLLLWWSVAVRHCCCCCCCRRRTSSVWCLSFRRGAQLVCWMVGECLRRCLMVGSSQCPKAAPNSRGVTLLEVDLDEILD